MKAKLITTALVANSLIAAWTMPARADGSGGSDGGAMDGGPGAGDAGCCEGANPNIDASGDGSSSPDGGSEAGDTDDGGTHGDAGAPNDDAGGGSSSNGGCSVSTAVDSTAFGGLAFIAATVGAIGIGFARRGRSPG